MHDMTHARECCCNTDQDPPCPGEQGFCVRVELLGFSSEDCASWYSGQIEPGCLSWRQGIVKTLVVNGPLTSIYQDIGDGRRLFLRAEGRGFSRMEDRNRPDECPACTDTDISAGVVIRCDGGPGGTGRPYLESAGATLAGGGNASRNAGPGTGPGANLFAWDGLRNGSPRVWLDGGPVVVPNDYGTLDNGIDYCGSTQALTESGMMKIEVFYGDQCPEESADYLVMKACDGSGREIIVDPDTNTGPPRARYEGEIYEADRRGGGDPVVVEWTDDECGSDTNRKYAEHCDTGERITYDGDLAGPDHLTCFYNSERYELTSIDSTDLPVAVVFSPDPCGTVPGDLRWAYECDGSERVPYDRDSKPQWARAGKWDGRDWDLTSEEATGEPVPMQWSSFRCGTFPDCSGINDPDDPRCDDPSYSHCPACRGGPDIGPPFPRPGFESEGEEPSTIPIGDAVAATIKLFAGRRFDGCSGCKKRRIVLNKYGDKLGRLVLKSLRQSGKL